jgi:hypothetical protein
MEAQPKVRLTSSELDILGYYYLKLSYWLGMSRQGEPEAKRANVLFQRALERARNLKDDCTAMSVERHMELLEQLRMSARPLVRSAD